MPDCHCADEGCARNGAGAGAGAGGGDMGGGEVCEAGGDMAEVTRGGSEAGGTGGEGEE